MADDALHVIVESLYIYPVKSCAGLQVEYLQFTDEGLVKDDRGWVVVNDTAEVVWQGSHPQLANGTVPTQHRDC
ncbi:MAG: MOSC N-terminal beta barrel domain-containing protein [Rhodoferax sp.]|jgi:uncharacterized protein YcbX